MKPLILINCKTYAEVSGEKGVAEPESAPQEIWRSILKILSFGLL